MYAESAKEVSTVMSSVRVLIRKLFLSLENAMENLNAPKSTFLRL